MIFVGDVAIAPGDEFIFNNLPAAFSEKKICINLEGSISPDDVMPNYGVVNSRNFMNSFERFNLAPTFLGNNHILDVGNGIHNTLHYLSENKLRGFGVEGEKLNLVQANCDNYLLLGYGWSVIGCKDSKKGKLGVSQLERAKVLNDVNIALRNNPDKKVVVVFHWNYEFEMYPQPGHRKLAHELLDIGCEAVIGHHPHIVGPVEIYKEKVIAYSLGNWAFSYAKFFDGKLKFPPSSYQQVALELCNNSAVIHWFEFIPPLSVNYIRSEPVNSGSNPIIAEFTGMDDDEYLKWFKVNRKKSFLLPIYLTAENNLENKIKNLWVHFRQVLIDVAVKMKIKSLRRNG